MTTCPEPEDVPCCPSCYLATGESVGMKWDGRAFNCEKHPSQRTERVVDEPYHDEPRERARKEAPRSAALASLLRILPEGRWVPRWQTTDRVIAEIGLEPTEISDRGRRIGATEVLRRMYREAEDVGFLERKPGSIRLVDRAEGTRYLGFLRIQIAARKFAIEFAERSETSVAELRRNGRFPEPCSCGEPECRGWAMGHAWEDAIVEDELRSRDKERPPTDRSGVALAIAADG